MRWGLVFVCLGACAPTRPLPLPDDEGAQTLLLIEPAATHLLGIDLSREEDPPPGALRSTRPLYARSYAQDLSGLGLVAGWTPLVPEGPGNRPLPAGLATHRADLTVDPPTWARMSQDEADEVLGKIHLPGADQGCERDGGCWVTEQGQPICLQPCPNLAPLLSPEPPTPPEPPQLGPCPATWSAVTSTLSPGLERCLPPELTCPPDEFRSLADAACQPEPCPADGWPANAPTDALFVDPTAAPGGDGSLAAPFSSLAVAVGNAPPGAILALRVGEHQAGLILNGVHLLGACRSQVVLLPSVNPRQATLSAGTHTVHLQGLTIRSGSTGQGLRVVSGARAELDQIQLEGGQAVAVWVEPRASLRARRSSIIGPGPLLTVTQGAVELSASRLQGGGRLACVQANNANLELTDLEVNGCSDGISLMGGGLTATRLSFRGLSEDSLILTNTATATISELYIRGGANGILVQSNSRLELARYFASAMRGRGVAGSQAKLTLRDLVFESTRETGLQVHQCQVLAHRVALAAVGRIGVSATGGELLLEDLRIDEVRSPTAVPVSINGLILDGPVTLRRLRVALSAGTAVYYRSSSGSRDELDLSDLEVVSLPAVQRHAAAINVVSGTNANVEAQRVRVRDWPGSGVTMQGATVTMEDLDIEAHGSSGMEVIDALFSLRRARITGTSSVALEIGERAGSTEVELEMVEIERAPGSIGLRTRGLASGRHRTSLRDFRITGPAAAAFDIDYVFYLELVRGRIDGSQVGLRLEQPSFPLSAVEEQIYFLNVPQKIDIRCRTTSPDCQD
ncbi:MAG: hypothetical protein IPG45_30815 [Deltaproteobacteria bacterium]|nr:hypothetical protein [Deltaproteobacteria bacterium]